MAPLHLLLLREMACLRYIHHSFRVPSNKQVISQAHYVITKAPRSSILYPNRQAIHSMPAKTTTTCSTKIQRRFKPQLQARLIERSVIWPCFYLTKARFQGESGAFIVELFDRFD